MCYEPLAGRRRVMVRGRRTKADWAWCIRELLEEHYPQAERLVLVLDNLNTDREGSVSNTVKQFFSPEQLHLVKTNSEERAGTAPDTAPAAAGGPLPSTPLTSGIYVEMARAVVAKIAVGQFKSTDCQKIISARWPDHPLASAGGAAFGVEFRNNIWPVLEGWGLRISNPGKKPIRYEMTEEARTSLAFGPGCA